MASAQSGTLYRGREGMWSWVAHRISGMLIFLFLLVHVLDTALVRVSPEAYNEVIGHYKTVVFGLGVLGVRLLESGPAVTGVGVAAAAAFSHVAYPVMRANSYSRSFATGCIAGSSVLGLLIPPSVFMIVWAILMAGFLPRHLMHMFGA